MPLEINPGNLQQLSGLNPRYRPQVWDWMDRGAAMDRTSLADTIGKAEYDAQMRPVKAQQERATLEQTSLANQMKQFDVDFYKKNQAQIDRGNIAKAIVAEGESAWKVTEARIKQGMASSDPTERAKATALWEGLPDYQDALRKHQFKLKEDEASAAARMKEMRERQRLDEAKQIRLAQTRAGLAKDLQGIKDAKDPTKLEAVLAGYVKRLEQASTPEEVAMLEESISKVADLKRYLTPETNLKPVVNPEMAGGMLVAPPKRENPYAGDAVKDRPNRENKMKFPKAPDIGTTDGGYVYQGGDPTDPKNWKQQ